jgi:hypothetical protein
VNDHETTLRLIEGDAQTHNHKVTLGGYNFIVPNNALRVKVELAKLFLDLVTPDAHNRPMPIASNAPSPTDRLAAIASADDDSHMVIRELLIDDDLAYALALTLDYPLVSTTLILELIRSLDRDALSLLRLDYSLCPLHARDYAICFDDDDAECAAIRDCFPSHDS